MSNTWDQVIAIGIVSVLRNYFLEDEGQECAFEKERKEKLKRKSVNANWGSPIPLWYISGLAWDGLVRKRNG